MNRDYQDKKIVVVGAGASGCGLTDFFLKRGAQVTLSDQRCAERVSNLDRFKHAGVTLDMGGHTEAIFTAADLVVISPGVPLTMSALVAAKQAGVQILGEVEVAWRELEAPMVAITGTNGKSTVTTLLGEMFRLWGKQTFVGGNLGTPLIDAVDQHWDWLAVELSSFQLEAIREFRPRYALMLNITEDHLDRYPDMSSYCAAKARLFENLLPTDVVVLNAEDPLVMQAAEGVVAQKVYFSSREVLESGMSLSDDKIIWRWQDRETLFPVGELQLRGRHNQENVMAALIPLLLEGCPPEVAWAAAKSFSGLPHRMELIGALNGVNWYNDSKGTNIGSVVKSLAGLNAPVTLIAGGKDKHGELAPLNDSLQSVVVHLVLIGEAAGRMAKSFAGLTEIHRAADMREAVKLAAELTPVNGAVLLSPGCSSFDMFSSFESRGRAFVEEFRALSHLEVPGHGN